MSNEKSIRALCDNIKQESQQTSLAAERQTPQRLIKYQITDKVQQKLELATN